MKDASISGFHERKLSISLESVLNAKAPIGIYRENRLNELTFLAEPVHRDPFS